MGLAVTLCPVVVNPQSNGPAPVSKTPDVHSFSQIELERRSQTQDEAKHFVPPWKAAFIKLDFFRRPTSQRTVTVVPLDASLPTIESRIEKVEVWSGGCDGEQNVSWMATIPVSSAAYLNAPTMPGHLPQSPFEVLVIYPAVPFAKALAVGELPLEMLPKNLPRALISAAVDVSGRGKPDLVVASYCCEGGGRSPNNDKCDLSCQDYYRKRNGRWFIVRKIRPC